ncbi:hypothetical protein O1611_g459 [Lasiodiplodia mahajangana]|uniref:Uncharacterized protein n=1 Tax=Lasiodiplodia mahajangana TaxID=1108764 RepID=A0ACC2K058_9PEZI|nr:hypothetical protein O1611_g459 [Lasiodiplodia mahajangana]
MMQALRVQQTKAYPLRQEVYVPVTQAPWRNIVTQPAMASGPIDDEPTQNLTLTLDITVWDSDKRATNQIGYLDTQADANLMSSVMASFLGLKITQYTGRSFSGAGHTTIVPQGQLEAYFSWKQSETNKLHKETFVVLDTLPYDIILGKKFLDIYKVYVFNGRLLPLALKPPSKEEKQKMEKDREAEKAQQEADEEAERAKRREERERQRQGQA